jgi:hypothetical protein
LLSRLILKPHKEDHRGGNYPQNRGGNKHQTTGVS